jgi:hypothetical protein
MNVSTPLAVQVAVPCGDVKVSGAEATRTIRCHRIGPAPSDDKDDKYDGPSFEPLFTTGGWWFKTVQLDLEAKYSLRGRTHPLRIHRC